MSDSIIVFLLIAGMLAYLYLGLLPFSFDFGRNPVVHVWFVTPVNGLLNWLCFIPFGVLIARLSVVDKPVLTALVCCALLSATVEGLQLFLPGRFACISDWVLNTTGGVTGALLVSRFYGFEKVVWQ